MGAILLRRERYVDADGDLVELVVWQVPRGAAYPDGLRYRLAFVLPGTTKPAVLYDNHRPKGTIDTVEMCRSRTPSPPSFISSWTSSRTFNERRRDGRRKENEGPD